MIAFIIEQNHEIKETFGYEIPFNEMTQQSMIQYACANYGPDSVVRNMTNEEKVKFAFQDQPKWLGGGLKSPEYKVTAVQIGRH